MKKFKLKHIAVLFALLFTCHLAQAAAESPVIFLERVSNKLFQELDRHQQQLGNQKVVSKIVYTYVVPYLI